MKASTGAAFMYTGQRRSQRVLMDMPIVIRGQALDRRNFQEETFTVSVSAHGALLMLATKVAIGQNIVIMNPANWDEREGRVAYVGPDRAGMTQVAIEFAKPSPEFWAINSPPLDWQIA